MGRINKFSQALKFRLSMSIITRGGTLGYTVSSHRSRAIRKSRPSTFDPLQKKVGSWVLPHLVAVFGQRQLGSGSWCDNKHGMGDTSGWRGGVQRGKGAEFDGPWPRLDSMLAPFTKQPRLAVPPSELGRCALRAPVPQWPSPGETFSIFRAAVMQGVNAGRRHRLSIMKFWQHYSCTSHLFPSVPICSQPTAAQQRVRSVWSHSAIHQPDKQNPKCAQCTWSWVCGRCLDASSVGSGPSTCHPLSSLRYFDSQASSLMVPPQSNIGLAAQKGEEEDAHEFYARTLEAPMGQFDPERRL
jgi:hypothetical protein